jgi:hypothetical protein
MRLFEAITVTQIAETYVLSRANLLKSTTFTFLDRFDPKTTESNGWLPFVRLIAKPCFDARTDMSLRLGSKRKGRTAGGDQVQIVETSFLFDNRVIVVLNSHMVMVVEAVHVGYGHTILVHDAHDRAP